MDTKRDVRKEKQWFTKKKKKSNLQKHWEQLDAFILKIQGNVSAQS